MIGTVVGPYRLDAELGSGGMGAVYRAEVVGRAPGLALGTVVALKLAHQELLRHPGFFKRILREGEIGKRIRHRNVVATLDLDAISVGSQTVFYLAMEHVEGRTLRRLFKTHGPAPEGICRRVALDIATGLEAIHSHGIVHRDLKPENVIVAKDRVVKVMDLGMAREIDDSLRLSTAGTFVGSVLYAAPEQFRAPSDGKLDGRADLFALGALLYELATGVHPFRRESDGPAQVVGRVLTETPPAVSELNPRISPSFDELVRVLLAKERNARFASAGELIGTLSAQSVRPSRASSIAVAPAQACGPA